MSSPARRVIQPTLFSAISASERQWYSLQEAAPAMTATMGRYLAQVATFLAPASVVVADRSLRQLVSFLTAQEPPVTTVGAVTRHDVEAFKVWLSAQPGRSGPLSANARRQRLTTLRVFFERVIEWGWEDAPKRNPLLVGDVPPAPEPLPKFLDDRRAAALMAVAAKAPLRDQLVVAMLARTGMRVGEFCGLAADAVVVMGNAHWLRVPVGKLRNDRFIPLHPELVELLADWTALNVEPIRHHRLLMADEIGPMNRYRVTRILNRLARKAGIGHVHPHQLRHTLATQALHRGMRLEAIAMLLGHRSMEMTMTYARITDRAVADQYAAVAAQVDALYGRSTTLPAEVETAPMARLRREATARMLGNGLCTRPIELECRMESACETCTYFRTNVEFTPTLRRQRDHAKERGQKDRAALFQRLLDQVEGGNT
jgi:site-specific recombinase XerD